MSQRVQAIVTGGGQGIGAAIGRRLAADGMVVHLLGRSIEKLEAQAAKLRSDVEASIYCHAVDVADEEAVQRFFTDFEATHGAPEVVVNNAGTSGSAPFHRTSSDHWLSMFSVNVHGLFHVCRAALPLMLENAARGRVINVASTAGLKGYPYVSAYCAAKHAVVGLTRALAAEYAKRDVTINAICPGFTETEMTETTVANIVEKTGRSEAQARADLASSNPQGRLVEPEEVADAVAWLCSPGARGITGQSIAVAGGEVT